MKFATRIFIGLFVILLITSLGYWWRYKRSYNYAHVVSSDANVLIDINLREIEQAVLWDFLYHPFSGISLEWPTWSIDENEDDDTPSKGLGIPRHLILFSQPSSPNVLFVSPVLIDGKKFGEYADTLVLRKEFEPVGNKLVFDVKKQLFYHWSETQLTAAFAKKKQVNLVKETLRNLLTTNIKSLPKSFIEKVKASEHQITILRKPSKITNNQPVYLGADFLNGHFKIEGDIPFEYVFSKENQAPNFGKKDVVSFWTNLDWKKNGLDTIIKNQFSNSDFYKWTNMSLDSMLQICTGEASVRILDIDVGVDSIVTYEYDEDFNKIEKVTTQQTIVPKANIHFSTIKDSLLYQYGIEKGVIKSVNDEMLYVGFPLLKLFAYPESKQLRLSTNISNSDHSPITTKDFFQLEINFQNHPELLDLMPVGIDEKIKDGILGMSVHCRQLPNSKAFHFEGKIKSTKSQRFFFGLK